MTTRVKWAFWLPAIILILSGTSASALSPVPTSIRTVLIDLNWSRAKEEEFAASITNKTWHLVPCPVGSNIITSKWIFKHKFNSNGTLERYKACWVLNNFTQHPGIDYNKTFNLVVKLAIVRLMLSLAVSHSWPVHQFDVKNSFLHDTLLETIYYSHVDLLILRSLIALVFSTSLSTG
jgi:hypothetical protein